MFLFLLLPPPKLFEEGPAKELAKVEEGRSVKCQELEERSKMVHAVLKHICQQRLLQKYLEQVENRETISECESGKAGDGSGRMSSSTK